MEGTVLSRHSLQRRRVLQAGGLAALASSTALGCDLLGTDPVAEGDGAGADDGVMEAPMLAELVESGDLPPLEERLPEDPLVITPRDEAGKYGGEWQSFVGSPTSNAALYRAIGYDQLMTWDPEFTTPLPNLAEVETLDDGREFLIHLRPGVKWSDGEPFTAADVLFAVNDVLINTDLYPEPPSWLVTGGEPGTFEEVDEYTVRASFVEPNGLFLLKLATPDGQPLTTHPRHYLEEFHAEYNEAADTLADEEGFPDWIALFEEKANRWGTAHYPTLAAWFLTTPLGDTDRVVAERNPYYWKVDPEGRQLPYIDRVVFEMVQDGEVLLLKATNGELHMESDQTITEMKNKPVLARSREEGDYDFFDVITASMNYVLVAFNLTHQDETKREIFNNRDFRVGLSHAIDRDELLQVLFQGQGEPWQVSPRPESTELADEEMAKQHTEYDVDLANELLDNAGFTERDGAGYRLGPDGKRISFQVDAPDWRPFWTDALEVIQLYWQEVGIEMRPQMQSGALVDERRAANEHDAAVWGGDGGMGPDIILDPRWYFPFNTNSAFAVAWANWYNDAGQPAEEPSEQARRQMELYDQVKATIDDEERIALFAQLLQITKEEFYAIGVGLPTGLYGVVKNNFRNIMSPMPSAWQYVSPGPTRTEQFFID